MKSSFLSSDLYLPHQDLLQYYVLSTGPMEPAMPRRKKYPGVAYKSNELFDPAPVDDIRPQQTSAFDRARVSY